MKLTTKRNRWYFFRELFSYMIPMILIVWTIDVFYRFLQCTLHPEWSAPCSVNWIFAVIYGIFLVITIILAIVSAKKLREIKKRIENEFFDTVDNIKDKEDNEQKVKENSEGMKKIKSIKSKKMIVKIDKKELVKREVKKNAKSSVKKKSSVKAKDAKK